MKLTSMSFPLMLLIRVSQGVFALLVLILSGFGMNTPQLNGVVQIGSRTQLTR
jgi:hypothetical protein